MVEKTNIQTIIIYIFIAAILGFLCLIIPSYLLGTLKQERHYGTFFYWVWENKHGSTVILWFLLGIFFGYKQSKIWFLWGLAVMSLFPILATYEAIVYPNSHNLLPFEFIMYAVLSIIPLLGSFTGTIIKNKVKKSLETKQSNQHNPLS